MKIHSFTRTLVLSLHLLYLNPVYAIDKEEISYCAKAVKYNDQFPNEQLFSFIQARHDLLQNPTHESYHNAITAYNNYAEAVAKKNWQLTFMHDAARSGDIEIIKNFVHLEKVRNLFGISHESIGLSGPMHTNVIGVNGATPLFVASSTDTMRELLALGAEVNALDAFGRRALHRVASFETELFSVDSKIGLLLSSGADIEAPDLFGNTPIIYAVIHGNTNAFYILREYKASLHVNSIAATNALIALYVYGDLTNYIQRSLNNQASLSSVHPEDRIARQRREVMVRLILDEDPSLINTVDLIYKSTALHWASTYGDTDVIKLLLDRGLSTDIINGDGETPLHVAARSDQVEAFLLLRSRDPGQLSVYDNHQHTPLESARQHNARNVLMAANQ